MNFLSGFRAPVVSVLPNVATFVGQIFEQGNQLWFSNGSAWIRLDNVPGGAGTVTSVGMTVPSGMTVSGSPVTGSGTLAVTISDAAAFRTAIGAGTGNGNGSVTSVGLSVPSQFTVSGSPVTGSGTLGFSWNSQTANFVLAAPNGSAGAPTFRALVAADIPALDASKVTTGVFSGSLLASLGSPSIGTVLTVGALGAREWRNLTTGDIVSGTLAVARGGTGVTTSTGSGNNVLSASPTFSGTAVFATATATLIGCSGAGGALEVASRTGGQPWYVYSSSGLFRVFENSTGDRMTIDASGNTVIAGTLTQNSDSRLKADVAEVTLPLEGILSVRAVEYTMIADGARGVGVLAQELQQLLPAAVKRDTETDMLSVAYGNAAITIALSLAKHLEAALARIEALESKS